MAAAAAGAAGGGAGADGAAGAVGALEAAAEVPPGAAVDAAGGAAAGAGATGGTGSARCTGAALLPVSFGGSTLAASELPSPGGLAAAGLLPASPADPVAGFSSFAGSVFAGLVLGRIGLGRVGLASLRFGIIGLGIIGFGVVGLGGLGFAGLRRGRTHAGLFVDDRPARACPAGARPCVHRGRVGWLAGPEPGLPRASRRQDPPPPAPAAWRCGPGVAARPARKVDRHPACRPAAVLLPRAAA